jgi:hypothetical protein
MVYATVVAFNVYGESDESAVGEGAIILTSPDPPINVIEYYAGRSATSLGLMWN